MESLRSSLVLFQAAPLLGPAARCLVVWMLIGSVDAQAHKGHSSDLAWRACDDAQLGDICSFDNEAHEHHVGTCRLASEKLVCVRNRPIEPTRAEQVWATPATLGISAFLVLAVVGTRIRTRSTA